jgi:hypothetical protein
MRVTNVCMKFSSRFGRSLQRLFSSVASVPPPLKHRHLVIGLGAMKTGTTWLSDYLASHPQFFHSPVKEMNSFAVIFPYNHVYPDYFYGPWPELLLWRMENTILRYGNRRSAYSDFIWNQGKGFDEIRALAQLNKITSTADYLQYFEERIGGYLHFGEISPCYAQLPAEAFACMSTLCNDVRFIFVMRDPTRRAISHIRQLRLRIHKELEIQDLLDRVDPSDAVFIRSDYRYTLATLCTLGLAERTKFLIYEDLFTQECINDLCDWLGLCRHPASFKKRVNNGSGDQFTAAQLENLRARLCPIYDDLRHEPLTQAAHTWLW